MISLIIQENQTEIQKFFIQKMTIDGKNFIHGFHVLMQMVRKEITFTLDSQKYLSRPITNVHSSLHFKISLQHDQFKILTF